MLRRHLLWLALPAAPWPTNARVTRPAVERREASGAHRLGEYQAAFTLLRPAETAKASRALWQVAPNRGNAPLNPRPRRPTCSQTL